MKKIILTERDLNILKFLWRHKVSTTAYVSLLFFKNCRPVTVHARLNRLKKAGYLKVVACPQNKKKLWTLTKKGFSPIREMYPDLKEVGFASEHPFHDMKVNIVQKGVFDTINSRNVRIVTEQEIRRQPSGKYPEILPKVGHRPDGYWIVSSPDRQRVIAIEYENSPKRLSDYVSIGQFYHCEDDIHSVVWVTEKLSLAQKIYNIFCEVSKTSCNKHIFILFEDFIKNNTNAKIQLGPNAEKPFIDFLLFNSVSRVKNPHRNFLTLALNEMQLTYSN